MTPLYVSIIVGYKDPNDGCESEEDEKNFATSCFTVDDIKDDFSENLLWHTEKALKKLIET
jgi:hypothetical protein